MIVTRTAHGRVRSAGGFILLEVLVAMALLGIGIVAVQTSVRSSLMLEKESETRYRAGLLLQQKLTEITAGGTLGNSGSELFGSTADSVYQWEVTSESWQSVVLDSRQRDRDDSSPPAPELSRVTVIVSWQARDRTRKIQASELLLGTTSPDAENARP